LRRQESVWIRQSAKAGRGQILRAFTLRQNDCLARFAIFKQIVVLFAQENWEIRNVALQHGQLNPPCGLGNFRTNDFAEWLSDLSAGRFMCFYWYTSPLLRNTYNARMGQILRPSMSSFLIAGDCKTRPDFLMPLSG